MIDPSSLTMAPTALRRLLCIFIILVAIPFFTHANPSSPFGSIKNLQGCKKGETVKDLHKLQSYLHRFGYLNYKNSPNENHFDDELEAALKTYQLNYGLKATGALDAETASKMAMPRCGVADVINGTNHMKRHSRHDGNRKRVHTISHYAFYEGDYKWPSDKTHLTYGFYQNVAPYVITAVGGAFDKWASASKHFTFSKVDDAKTADLKIGFERGDHGDGDPFDGPSGVLAHSFAPTDGRFHYDIEEMWVVGAVENAFDLETVALHEIGHLLGLEHSHLEDAIMFPVLPIAATKGLHDDDIQGIRTLYNA